MSNNPEEGHAKEAAVHSERGLRAYLATAPDATILVRRDGTILHANEQVESVFGYPPHELLGASLDILIPDRSRQPHASHQSGYFAKPIRRAMGRGQNLYALRKDGTEFPVDISLSTLEEEEDVIVVAAIRDVSARVEQQRVLRAALKEVKKLQRRLQEENAHLREDLSQFRASDELVGETTHMRQVSSLVSQVAPTDSAVLILGETGTGKELVARAIHANSRRADRILVKVNCATLPSTLVESELFGHEKGAFTGAIRQHIGRFELADGGTIFLDEIGDLPIELQPKLLRVLQEGEFERLGSTKTFNVDVRVIAATNRDLDQAVAAGDFRKDLFFRLQVFPIVVSPLRERPADIPLLVWHILNRTKLTIGRPIESVPDEAMQQLQRYSWPGNVRELENVIERAIILTHGTSLQLEQSFGQGDIGHATPPDTGDARLTRLEDVERAHIVSVLEACGWRIKGKSNAAEQLGLHPSTLLHRLKKLGIKRPASARLR